MWKLCNILAGKMNSVYLSTLNDVQVTLEVCASGGNVERIRTWYVVQQPPRREYNDNYYFNENGLIFAQLSKAPAEICWHQEPEQELGDYRPPVVFPPRWKRAFKSLARKEPAIADSLTERVNFLETPGPKFKE